MVTPVRAATFNERDPLFHFHFSLGQSLRSGSAPDRAAAGFVFSDPCSNHLPDKGDSQGATDGEAESAPVVEERLRFVYDRTVDVGGTVKTEVGLVAREIDETVCDARRRAFRNSAFLWQPAPPP